MPRKIFLATYLLSVFCWTLLILFCYCLYLTMCGNYWWCYLNHSVHRVMFHGRSIFASLCSEIYSDLVWSNFGQSYRNFCQWRSLVFRRIGWEGSPWDATHLGPLTRNYNLPICYIWMIYQLVRISIESYLLSSHYLTSIFCAK